MHLSISRRPAQIRLADRSDGTEIAIDPDRDAVQRLCLQAAGQYESRASGQHGFSCGSVPDGSNAIWWSSIIGWARDAPLAAA